jgi:phosphopantetheine adenylyltransferase
MEWRSIMVLEYIKDLEYVEVLYETRENIFLTVNRHYDNRGHKALSISCIDIFSVLAEKGL